MMRYSYVIARLDAIMQSPVMYLNDVIYIYEHEPPIATDENFPYCEQCSWLGR
jgi:hypothetical protein